MADQSTSSETITLKVIRVACREVLGQTKPLQLAKPGRFANAKGDLREVDGFREVGEAAARSAQRFLAANFAALED